MAIFQILTINRLRAQFGTIIADILTRHILWTCASTQVSCSTPCAWAEIIVNVLVGDRSASTPPDFTSAVFLLSLRCLTMVIMMPRPLFLSPCRRHKHRRSRLGRPFRCRRHSSVAHLRFHNTTYLVISEDRATVPFLGDTPVKDDLAPQMLLLSWVCPSFYPFFARSERMNRVVELPCTDRLLAPDA